MGNYQITKSPNGIIWESIHILAKSLKRIMPIPTSHRGKRRNTMCLWWEPPRSYFRDAKFWQNMLKRTIPFKKECAGTAKIPISDTLSGLVETDFVEYGDCAAFLHIRDALSRFSVAALTGSKKKATELRKWPAKRRFRIG